MDSALIEAPDSVMAISIATLEERVSNHIKFFWVVVAFGFIWLAALTTLMIQVKGTVGRVEIAQADAPARMVAELLSKPTQSKEDLSVRLSASVTILRSSPPAIKKPDSAVLKAVSDQLAIAQDSYRDVPEVWQATSAFINYKAEAMLPASSSVAVTAKGINCSSKLEAQIGLVVNGCEIDLEDLSQHFTNNTVNGVPAPFVFIDCIVHYSGGSISAKRLIFKNCI